VIFVVADGHVEKLLMILAVNTPVIPPSVAPVEYISLCLIVPIDMRLTLPDQKNEIPNPAIMIPGQNRRAIKSVLADTRNTCKKAVRNSFIMQAK
jgi:hypothetical protein